MTTFYLEPGDCAVFKDAELDHGTYVYLVLAVDVATEILFRCDGQWEETRAGFEYFEREWHRFQASR